MHTSASPSSAVALAPIAEPCHALQLFDSLPAGFVAFTVPDRSCEPLIMQGETAVIEIGSPACEPENGALYLRRAMQGDNSHRLSIVEAIRDVARLPDDDGTIEARFAWYFNWHNRPANVADWPAWAMANGPVPMADGPFFFGSKRWPFPYASVIGRVVGILADLGRLS